MILLDLAEIRRDQEMMDQLGLEGLSFQEYLETWTSKLRKFFSTVFNEDVTGALVKPKAVGELRQLMDRWTYDELQKITVIRPLKLDTYMLNYTDLLIQQLTALQEIVERLYRPATVWMARCINNADFYKKAWLDKDLQFAPMKDFQKELMACFSHDQKDRRGDSSLVPFSDLYANKQHYERVFLNLERIFELATSFDLKAIKQAEGELVRNIEMFITATGKDGVLEDMSEFNRKKLADVIRAIGEETSYMSGLLHFAATATAAYNETTVKLLDNLKK